jgi:hypothetical protein
MKPVEAILAAALLLGLAGCALRAKPPAPAAATVAPKPPPEPLSIPQTTVQLPRQQPLDPDSFSTAEPDAPPPAPPPPPPAKPPQKKNARTAPSPPPKTETPAAPVEEVRPPVREIIPANEQQQLRRSTQDHQSQAQQLVAQAQRRRLTAAEQALVTRINQFLKSSVDAERSGDLRSADDLAGRAHILAKELQSGK